MEFSKIADSSFTWTINGFEESNIGSLKEKTFFSENFTTSIEPSRQWHMVLSIIKQLSEHCERCKQYEHKLKSRLDSSNGATLYPGSTRIRPKKYNNFSEICKERTLRKIIDLKFICDKIITDPADIKINVSVTNDEAATKIYTRSFIISGDEKEFGFKNFIDYEELLQMTKDDKLEILVEMFLRDEEENKGFEAFINSEFLSDIQIQIEDSTFFAHKAILASKSSYFYNMFQQNKTISQVNNLQNIKPDAFLEILKYIYSNVVDKWSLSCDILLGANVLQMNNLKSKCEQYLRKNITVQCVCPVLMLAVECNTKSLIKHCLYYLLKNLNLLGKTGNFQCLKTEPVVILNILEEIFDQCSKGRLIVIDNIKVLYQESVINTCCHVLHDYEPFLNSKHLSDITIKVGDKIYQSHKLVLVAKSPVLRRMLSSNMKESLNNLIEITDIKPEVFLEVLRYMYTGKVENLKNYGTKILKAADKYSLDHLKSMCEKFLAQNLTPDNVVKITKLADTYNAIFLGKQCINYMVKTMVYYSQQRNTITTNILNSFLDNHSIILYNILIVLSMNCEIEYC